MSSYLDMAYWVLVDLLKLVTLSFEVQCCNIDAFYDLVLFYWAGYCIQILDACWFRMSLLFYGYLLFTLN